MSADPRFGTAIVTELVKMSDVEGREQDANVLEAICNSFETSRVMKPEDVSYWIRACVLAGYALGRNSLTNAED